MHLVGEVRQKCAMQSAECGIGEQNAKPKLRRTMEVSREIQVAELLSDFDSETARYANELEFILKTVEMRQ